MSKLANEKTASAIKLTRCVNLWIIILLFCVPFTSSGQFTEVTLPFTSAEKQESIWLEKIEHPDYKIFELKIQNSRSDFLSLDFSKLLSPRTDFIGYIGPDCSLFQIFFDSVRRDISNYETYQIKGITVLNGKKRAFSGTIRIDQIRKYKSLHLGVDEIYKDSGIKAEGILIGRYRFREDSTQEHSGLLRGIMDCYWYIDRHNLLRYDDIELGVSDSYMNNQYVGSWKEYGKHNAIVCNWGEFRIPFSGDLDIGAGEFSPNSKYSDQGWKAYSK